MTRLFTEGVEMGDLLFFDASTGATNVTTTNPRSGTYAGVIGAGSRTKNITAAASIYLAVGIHVDGAWAAQIRWLNAGTALGNVQVDLSVGRVKAYTSTGTLVATGTVPIQLDTWYLIEIYVLIGNSPTGRIIVKVDGITDIDFTGDTQPAAVTQFNQLQLYQSNASGSFFFDDFAADDAGWIGDLHVSSLMPDAAGDHTGQTASAGNNYDCVNERPPNTTDYVYGGLTDLYDLYNLPASGLSGASISRVWSEARCLVVTAPGNIAVGLKTNGTEYWGADQALTTGYLRYSGDVHTVNPQTTSAWAISELDALQIGTKVR